MMDSKGKDKVRAPNEAASAGPVLSSLRLGCALALLLALCCLLPWVMCCLAYSASTLSSASQ